MTTKQTAIVPTKMELLKQKQLRIVNLWLMDGVEQKDIAARLRIKVDTVNKVLNKYIRATTIGVATFKNRKELLVKAMELKQIELNRLWQEQQELYRQYQKLLNTHKDNKIKNIK